MKLFLLNVGEILIDEIDVPVVQSCSWKLTGWGYIQGSSKNNPYRLKYLHKIIAKRMGLNCSKFTDHKDGNLSNQRLNLREATHIENNRNRKKQLNTSGYKGVTWNKRLQKWQARIYVNGKPLHLGYFDDPKEAHVAYCKAADLYFGEFARYD